MPSESRGSSDILGHPSPKTDTHSSSSKHATLMNFGLTSLRAATAYFLLSSRADRTTNELGELDDYRPEYSVFFLPWSEARRLHGSWEGLADGAELRGTVPVNETHFDRLL